MGFEPIPGKKYRSPIRPDDTDPSFNIFYVTRGTAEREFMWKDQATGRVGDIFGMVQGMHNPPLTRRQAELKIAGDFNLTSETISAPKVVLVTAPKKTDIEIHIHSRRFTTNELKYWAKYNVSPQLLAEYNVTAFDFYWLMRGQVVPYTAPEYSFAYRIQDRYKLYWPFEKKEDKFRNNLRPDDVEGLAQYIPSDLLIITKATKDVLFLRSIGLTAVAAKSENTYIPEATIRQFLMENKRVITLFDNDGKHKAQYYKDSFGIFDYHIPLEYGFKDPTDLAAGTSIKKATQIIHELLDI